MLPRYDPDTHYLELTKSGYFRTLIFSRHYMKIASDYYFGVECGAKNIDLFILTLVFCRQWDQALIQNLFRLNFENTIQTLLILGNLV
jgi:hypothetical protein